jgi:hypothetical protein
MNAKTATTLGGLLVVIGGGTCSVISTKHDNACSYAHIYCDRYAIFDNNEHDWLEAGVNPTEPEAQQIERRRKIFESGAEIALSHRRYLEAITFSYEVELRKVVRECAEEMGRGEQIARRAAAAAQTKDLAALKQTYDEYAKHSANVEALKQRAEAACR